MSPNDPHTVAAGGRYGPTAQALHWLTALLVFVVVPLAWIAVDLPKEAPSKAVVFAWHKSVGITILALIGLRLVWRRLHPPPEIAVEPKALATLARVNHWLLYAIFLIMPVTGFLLSAFNGNALPYFYLFEIPGFSKNKELHEVFETIHVVGQWAVYLFVALHVLASVWHATIRKDRVLGRMLPRREGAA
jgi:cytochrome b561